MNIQKMMQQAQAMQQKMTEMQEKLGDITVEGGSGGGAVKIQMTCKGQVTRVNIDPDYLTDHEMVEDLVKAAINNARDNADKKLAEETQKIMEDMGLPPGMQLPF